MTAENDVTLTDAERDALRGFVAGGNRAKVRGEWVWDTKTQALHAAVEGIVAARLACVPPPVACACPDGECHNAGAPGCYFGACPIPPGADQEVTDA